MKKVTQKWLAILLSLAMTMSMLPTAAFAVENETDAEGTMSLEEQFASFVDSYEDTGATVSSDDDDAIPDDIIGGSSTNPFYIGSATVLAELATLVNGGSSYAAYSYAEAYYVMVGDIDLNDMDWTAIGKDGKSFSGTFDGAGFEVSGLNLNHTDNATYQGLFGLSGGTIQNLTVSGTVYSTGTNVGGVAGANTGIVENCISHVDVTGASTVGGVVGINGGSAGIVQNCIATGTIKATTSYAGGVVGTNGASNGVSNTVANCVALNETVTSTTTGRVVGEERENTTTNSGFTGTLTNNYAWSGMKIGSNGSEATVSSNDATSTNGAALTYSADTGLSTSWSDIYSGWSDSTTTLPNGDDLPGYITSSASDEGGDDTSGYIQISTAAELEKIGVDTATHPLSGSYILTQDIDLSVSYSSGWTPIGTGSGTNAFTGTFDGGGHTISGLYIDNSDSSYQGLFGYAVGATIQNVHVEGEVTGSGSIGGVVGYNYNGTVDNCSFSGTVTGASNYVGGVVGDNRANATVSNCSFSGTVYGASFAGGVVGYNYGNSETVIVTNCYSSGTVTGTGATVGGVVGHNYAYGSSASATVTNCYSTATVTGTSYGVGGVVGGDTSSSSGTATVSNCYSTGSVTGEYRVGGVVGYSSGTISNCVALGASVTATTDVITVDRVVGYNSSTATTPLSNNYAWSGMTVTNSTGVTTATNDATSTDGADLTYSADTSALTGIDAWSSVFTTDMPSDWTGTLSTLPNGDPLPSYITGAAIEISTQEQLAAMELDGNYILVNDIELTGDWTPIGTSTDNAFKGIFDGGGYTISGLSISSDGAYLGLFGVNSGTVKNVHVSGTVSGISTDGTSYVGGVVALNQNGTVSGCSFAGSASGVSSNNACYVGGVVGRNLANVDDGIALIENCYNTATVTSTGTSVGGITAHNNTELIASATATVTNCYNTGTVTGSKTYAGGIVGRNLVNTHGTATVSYCYNTGTVSGSAINAGGVVGMSDGTVSNVVSLASSVTGGTNVGRVIGSDSGTTTNTYALATMTCTGTDGTDLYYSSDAGLYKDKDITSTFSWASDVQFNSSVWDIPTTTYQLPMLTDVSDSYPQMSLSDHTFVTITFDYTDSDDVTITFESGGVLAATSIPTLSDGTSWGIADSKGAITFAEGGVAYYEDATYTPLTAIASVNGTSYTSLANAITAAGTTDTVKLLTSIQPTATVSITSTVTLDLNGYVIDANNQAFSVITIGSDGTLTLKDSNGENTGKITGGNPSGDGGGVYVTTGATFTMTGGEISGNTSGQYGGGVYVGGSFTMTGGEISSNTTASHGGGVHISSNGTFTMTGGTIGTNTSNSAPEGVGVYVGNTFKLSGNPSISEVYLGSEKVITITGALGTTTTIPVTTATTLNVGDSVTITSGASENATTSNFTSTQSYSVGTTTGGEIMLINPVATVTANEAVTYYTTIESAIAAANTNTGTVKLWQSVETTATLPITKTVTLDLNGKTIDAKSGDWSVITVSGNLTLTDTAETGGGKITGANTASHGGGVYVESGTFTMEGGTIDGNTVTGESYFGGGVYVAGTFYMKGGTISNNSVATYGGGVFIASSGKAYFSGGTISDNTATTNGNGIHVNSGASTDALTLSGDVNISDAICLTSSKVITIGDNFTGSAAVVLNTALTNGASKVITSGASGKIDSATFTSTQSYNISTNSSGEIIFVAPLTAMGYEDYLPLPADGTLTTDNNYYLYEDYTGDLKIGEDVSVYLNSKTVTGDVTMDGGTLIGGGTIDGTLTVKSGSVDGTITLADEAVVTDGITSVTVTGEATYSGTEITVSDDENNYLTYGTGTTITEGTVTIISTGLTSSGATVDGCTIKGDDDFTIEDDGDIVLTAGKTYTINGVEITVPSDATDGVTATINAENGTISFSSSVTYGDYDLTDAEITTSGAISATSVTVGDTVLSNDDNVTIDKSTGAVTGATSIIVSNETYSVSGETTATVDSTGKVTFASGATLTNNDVTIVADEDSTINDDGTITLTADSTVAGVSVVGTVTVNDDGTITTGSDATVAGSTITGAAYTINSDGSITLTAETEYTINGVTIAVPEDDDVTATIDDDGTISFSSSVTATYGDDTITLGANATITTAGAVTASKITIGEVIYTAPEGETISIDDSGEATYPADTEIDFGDYTITLGEGTSSAEIDDGEYPAGTKVEYGDDDDKITITLEVDGTIDTEEGEISATQVTVNGTKIVSTTDVSVDIDTGETTLGESQSATVTTNGVEMTVTGGTVDADGDVTTASEITVDKITVSGDAVSADADGIITASEGDKITDGDVIVTVAESSSDVTIEDNAIVMDAVTDSLTYGSTTITATGEVTLEESFVGLPEGATVTTGGVTITVASAPAGVVNTGTVVANAVTVGDLTITAEEDKAVSTDASGKTTITTGETATVKVGDVTMTITGGTISAAGTVTGASEITIGEETYAVDGDFTIADDGTVSLASGTTLTQGDLTITASTDGKTTINTDGTVALSDGATVGDVEVTGEAIYDDGTVKVEDENSLSYAGQTITAGTVTVANSGVTSSSATVDGYTIVGDDDATFTVGSTGIIALTDGETYEVEGVDITVPEGEDVTMTTGDTISISGTVTYGSYDLTGAEITKSDTTGTLTTTEAALTGDVTFTGNLEVDAEGISSTEGTITATYTGGPVITLDEDASVDEDGDVTASEITIGEVIYTNTETSITIATTGVANYPEDTVIVDDDYTITLGDEGMDSDDVDAGNYPAGTEVVYDDDEGTTNTIILGEDGGTIDTATGEVSATTVTVNGTKIVSTTDVSVDIDTGKTALGESQSATVTTNGVEMTVTGGTISAAGTVTGASEITIGGETYDVVGDFTIADDGTVILAENTTLTQDGLTITAATGTTINSTGTVALSDGATVGDVEVTGEAIYDDGTVKVEDENSLSYAGQTITAGTVTVTSSGVTSSSATVDGYTIVGDDDATFTVGSTGIIALTDGETYEVEGVDITVPADADNAVDAVTMTTGDDEITITGTVGYGEYELTNAEVTKSDETGTLTTTEAVYTDETGTVTFTGNLEVDASGITSTEGTITATYDDDTVITLDEDASVDEYGDVTASEITIGEVTYSVDEEGETSITIATTGVANYPEDTVIVDDDYTITLGGATTSTAIDANTYPSGTEVVYTDSTTDPENPVTTTIILGKNGGTIDTEEGEISATQVTVNGVEIVSDTAVTIDSDGAVTIPAGSTITVGDETFTVTNETEVTVADDGEISIPEDTVLEKDDATITISTTTTISNTGVVTLPTGTTVSNADGDTVTLDAEGTYTNDAVESQKVTLSDGSTETTITASGENTVTVAVDSEDGVTATAIPASSTITNGSSTVTTVTENITVSATDGTITVPEDATIATEGMEITMGTDGSDLTLSDSSISLPENSVVQDTTTADAPAITIAEGVTGATVSLGSSAGTISATKVTIGSTALASTTGDLTVTLTGAASFPSGGTVTTTDESGNTTERDVSTNGSATVSGDGTMSYPSTGSGSSSYSSNVSTNNNGSVSISSGSAASGSSVTITATPDEGYEIASVTVTYASGREVTVTDNGDGTYSYLQPGATVTVTVTFVEEGTVTEEQGTAVAFTDVSADAYYYDAMVWAVENGITSGYADDTFRATDSCTRAQAVTFLWRAAGCPEATTDNPFSDLDESTYYYDAVLWAVENGITTGYSDGSFGADATCNRGAIVTFLYRLAGEPEVDGEAMSDVSGDAYYYNAVLWAVENGITTGYADGTFQSVTTCNRGAIVTFLYRYLA